MRRISRMTLRDSSCIGEDPRCSEGATLDIVIGLAEADCRGWLVDFNRDLQAAGYSPRFDIRSASGNPDRRTSFALALETSLYGIARDHWLPLAPSQLPRSETGDLSGWTLDLSGLAKGIAGLTLSIGDDGSLAELPAFLFARNWPSLSFRDANGRPATEGLPSVEGPEIALNGLREITRRISTLAVMALDGKARPAIEPVTARRATGSLAPLVFTGRTFIRKLIEKASPARFRADHWRTGLRPARSLEANEVHPPEGFTWLDDRDCFFADPVLWEEAGRSFLFVEAFPYATGRGIISYTELGADGVPLFAPKPVIERATHLSYPYLFRHDGAIYMMPENAAERHVPLYRARRFPDDWQELPPLLAGHDLHDATLFEHEGRWWILANLAPHGKASWDCLVAFHADSPLGPFSPHALNPILVDARHSRPAGPPLRVGSRLIRPVQDGYGGYGRKLHFFEIETLTPDRFSQRRLGGFAPPADDAMRGLHTYGRTSRFEVIDALFPRGRR